jgi:redox-sensing transcriptional repressor
VPIYHIDDLQDYQRRLNASIGILAVPADQAQDAADTMAAAGLKAIWNFTPYRIKVTEGIVMANTSIYAHLALIYNRLSATT